MPGGAGDARFTQKESWVPPTPDERNEFEVLVSIDKHLQTIAAGVQIMGLVLLIYWAIRGCALLVE